MFSEHMIISHREDEDAAVDDDTPIHRTRHDGRRKREEGKHEDRSEVAERGGVDDATVTSERPAAVGERLAADTLQEDAADGDHVGGDEGGNGDGCDGLEGDGAADVDEGEKDGDHEGDDDGIQGDVPAWGDL